MPVHVLIDFPISAEQNDALLAERPELIEPIGKLLVKHGALSHARLKGEGRYIDIDVFPSREVYHAFKAEAQPYIDAYEGALGVRSVDTIWELTDEIDLTTLS
ncbi:MAG: hypothetical protein KDB25_01025 [Leucobacter sp.]|nr:hypothetical protein [Leucobacter sp.]